MCIGSMALCVVFVVLLLAFSLTPCRAAAVEEVYSFTFKQGQKLDWYPNSGVSSLRISDNMLKMKTSASDPLIMGPLFGAKADSRQYVEITMQSSADGSAQLYYTNTTEEPYGGIRPELCINFSIKKGSFRVYRLFPYWGGLTKIIRFRLDPPDNSDVFIKSIRILQLPDGRMADKRWQAGALSTWSPMGDVKATPNSLVSTGELMLISPKWKLLTDDAAWISLIARTTGASLATVQWMSSDGKAMHSCTIPMKTDGLWHSYNLPTATMNDWVGTVQAMALSINTPTGKTTEIRQFGVGGKPSGNAELTAPQFMLEQNFVRVGQPAELSAVISNSGGVPSKPQKLTIRWNTKLPQQLTAGEAVIKTNAVQTIPSIKPGESIKISWPVGLRRAGWVMAELIPVGSKNVLATTMIQANPNRPVLPQGQIPAPVAARSNYDVGVYYFPGWWNYTRWAVLNDYPERTPLLGYYKEGDPDVADWHIKWMVEHGINFIAYDWYWSAGNRSLEHALHQGLFNAKYQDQIKFCLLWANHNPPGTSSEEDLKNVTQYWLDNYFMRSNYYTIDGKPVVIIFAPTRFSDDIGAEAVKRAFDNARKMCQQRGLPGLYFIACSAPNEDGIKLIEKQGYDAISGYNYPGAGTNGETIAPYDLNIRGYEDIWKSIAKMSKLRYIPVTDPGWDSRPWAGPNAMRRTGKAPWKFEQMLKLAKDFADVESAHDARKVVLVEAWNELGEGDFIEPHRQWGFGYLDAIRRVFAPTAVNHLDIVPEDVGVGPYTVAKPVPATSWDFSDPQNPGWEPLFNIKDFKAHDGMISGVSTNWDSSITSQPLDIDAVKVKSITIKMRVSAGKAAQLYWTAPGAGASEAASASFNLVTGTQMQTYRIELSKIRSWRGKIASFRFDPTDIEGASFDVELIHLEMK